MRIALITPEFPGIGRFEGGLANYTKRVAMHLSECGHEVLVFIPTVGTTPPDNYPFSLVGVVMQGTPLLERMPGARRFTALAQLKVGERIAEATIAQHESTPLDIVHLPSYGSLGIGLLRRKRFPTVCRISSYGPVLRTAYGRRTTFPDRLVDRLETTTIKRSDGAFSPSIFMARIYEEATGIRPAVIRTPPPSPEDLVGDVAIYERDLKGLRYLVFVGNLSPVKGVDLIVEALPNLFQMDESLHMVLIGRDDGFPNGMSMEERIKVTCSRWCDRIHILPSMDSRFIFPIMKHSLGLLAPSRVDNYPNVCLEAHGLGVPVVGTRDSSLEEMVVDSSTGFLLDDHTAHSLIAAVARLLDLSRTEQERMHQAIFHEHRQRLAAKPLSHLESFYASHLTQP